jgi:thiazolylpeptide-type bacteriocin precursor
VVERNTRKLIANAGMEGADETDDSIFERHQKTGGSGVVRKTELDDYKKRKFKYFQDKLAAEKDKESAASSSSSSSSSSTTSTAPGKTTATDNSTAAGGAAAPVRTKRARWDATPVINSTASGAPTTAGVNRWDATPVIQQPSASSSSSTTTTSSTGAEPPRRKRWDATPVVGPSSTTATDAVVGKKRSRWDETPVGPSVSSGTNAFGGATGAATASRFGETPLVFPTGLPGSSLLNAPADPKLSIMQLQALRYQKDLGKSVHCLFVFDRSSNCK